MKTHRPKSVIGAGAGAGLGFLLVLVLLAIFGVTAMMQMASMSERVNQLVHSDAVKVELIHNIVDSINGLSVSLDTMAALTDPFEKDDEYLRSLLLGNQFLAARQALLDMQLNAKEREILEQVRQLAANNRPRVAEAVQLSISGENQASQKIINDEIAPRQRQVLNLLYEFLEIHSNNTRLEAKETEQAYLRSQWLMLGLGGIVSLLSLFTAVAVVRHTNAQSKLLRYQALYDGLTGSPNRSLFSDRLQQTILSYRRQGKSFGMIAVDLDLFKEVNDRYGHQAGDEVLRGVARVINQCLRDSDTVARMGGDEFSILMPSSQTVAGTVVVAQRIIEKLREPIVVHNRELEVSASMGVAQFPEHAEEADVLQSHADSAMYQAKRTHTGYAVYDAGLQVKSDEGAELQATLRKAITNDELVLHYQPKIEFATRSISGVEALVRWQHPTRGLLSPDKFVPLAENTELIRPLTECVLRMAIKQCATWLRGGIRLSVAVNVSAINIQDAQFPDLVIKILKEHELPAQLLELELTESAVMSKPKHAIDCIRQLNEYGVQVSIDDFGTGYTSMSQLRDLLVAKIKIDRSFVKNMVANHNDAVIVRTTVDLGHNLGFKVVAEGVEDQATWDHLETLGCDSAQGFHMSKPLTPAAFIEWLNSSPWGKAGDVGK